MSIDSFDLGMTLSRWSRDHGTASAKSRFMEAIDKKEIQPRQLAFGRLAEGMFGSKAPRVLRAERIVEATDGTDVSLFSNITGQILITEVLKQYEAPEFIARKMVRTIAEPSNGANLGEHLMPRISQMIDLPESVQPGMPYERTTLQEDYIAIPPIVKKGREFAITLEALLADKTGQLTESASKLGYAAGYEQEEEGLRVILGLVNNHKWRGTSYNTYVTSGGNWANQLTGVTVAGSNWQIINNAEQLFAQMKDPITSRVINVQPNALFCMPESYYTFKNIIGADKVRTGDITSGDGTQGEAPNPLDTSYPITMSKIARQLLIDSGISTTNVRNYWYLMDSQKAFGYRELLPLEVVQAPPQNPAEFHQDIMMLIKVRRMGVFCVLDPRYTARIYGS